METYFDYVGGTVYSCKICGNSVKCPRNQYVYVKRHMLTHHTNMEYKCTQCDFRCRCVSTLKYHKAKNHKK